MIGAHPELKEQLIESKHEEENNKKERRTEKKTEVDFDEDKTCPHCFKIFYNKQIVKRHIKTCMNAKVK